MMAPVPMTMSNPASSVAASTIEFPCGADKQSQFRELTGAGVPLALASRGMTPTEWAECCDGLNSVLDAQFFKNCPALECCYFCVPGGPIQCCLCMINPVTCILCIQPVEEAKKKCKQR